MADKQIRKIQTLKNWDKNPRGILKDDFERLKKQIQKLGQYKPLVITEDGTVLGGNMRLRAYLELGIEDIWVSIVEAPDDKTKLEYALSDNDRAGYYEENNLAELINNTPELELDLYKVDLSHLTSLKDLQALMTGIEQVNEMEEWVGMPEFENKFGLSLIISFDTEQGREEIVDKIGLKEFVRQRQKAWILHYPPKPREKIKDKKYELKD